MATAATLEELPRWARDLLSHARVGHLGLLDDHGRPRVLPVTFAITQGAVWSAIDEKPKRRGREGLARLRWLRCRPESAITVDRYDDDWSRLAWIQLVGRTAVVELEDHTDIVAALARRYPQYRRASPPGPLLRLTPERIVHWRAADAG